MISFKQFLSEEKNELSLIDIRDNCSIFLSEVSSPLYRGFQDQSEHIKYFDFPESRQSKDSSKIWNMLYNYAAEKVLGVENIRSKTLFASGAARQAYVYGDVQMVFLKGKYKCVGSKHTHDTFNDIEFTKGDLDLKVEKILKLSNDDYPYLDDLELNEILHKAASICGDIEDEMEFTNAMIEGFDMMKRRNFKTGIDIPKVEANISKIYKLVLKNAIDAFNEAGMRNMTIQAAIDTKNEIGLYEGEGYYLLSPLALDTMLRNGDLKPKTKEGGLALVEIVKMLHANKLRITSAFQGKIFMQHFKTLINDL